MRDFFFRVAALTFESSVLAELERSSTRKIGDTVREYLRLAPRWVPVSHTPPTLPPSLPLPLQGSAATRATCTCRHPARNPSAASEGAAPGAPHTHTSGPKRSGPGRPRGAVPAVPQPSQPLACPETHGWGRQECPCCSLSYANPGTARRGVMPPGSHLS